MLVLANKLRIIPRQPDNLTHPQMRLGSRLCVLLFQVVCLFRVFKEHISQPQLKYNIYSLTLPIDADDKQFYLNIHKSFILK
jgi:hypothetical protein